MRKGYWYLSGFRTYGLTYGLKYWLLALIAKIFYALHLIGDEDCKNFANALINSWILERLPSFAIEAYDEQISRLRS